MEENRQEVENEQNTASDQEVLERIEKKRRRTARYNFFALGVLVGLLVAFLLTVVLVGGGILNPGAQLAAGSVSKTDDTVLTNEVKNKIGLLEDSIHEYYLGDTTNEDLETGIYKGMVDALGDPYSEYYTPDELNTLRESTEGIYYGIGAYIGIDGETEYCKITSVIPDTPAEAAGLQAEDIIVEVDGTSTKGMTTTDVVALIKGEENTDVTLTVYRKGETDYLDITVTRKKVEAPTVSYKMLDSNIAYIQIAQFEDVTGDQFTEQIAKAREDGMKALILDLRNNPGGTLTSVIEVARQLLPKGLIVYTEDKNGERDEYKCDGSHELEVPLVVLVNENSASASEILSGAIKDYGIGTLLGTTTFGKGIVQKVFGITDGSAVKLTISHYYTPNGNDIHGVGIEPDETLDLDVDQYLKDGTDNQLKRATEILEGEIAK